MGIRKTIQWLVVLVVLAGLTAGGYAYWVWNQSDELLRQAILSRVREAAPGWNVQIARARFDWLSRRHVHIYDVTLAPADRSGPLVRIPEVVLNVDQELLEKQQKVDVQRIRLRNPHLWLARAADGQWNWQKLPLGQAPLAGLPEIVIEDGSVEIKLDQPDGSAPVLLALDHADAQFVPAGKRRFRVTGRTQAEQAGTLEFDAQWNLDDKTWTVTGGMRGITTDARLLNLAAATSPELRDRIIRADASLRRVAGIAETPPASPNGIPDLGLAGMLDIEFQIARPAVDQEPQFSFDVAVRSGHITHPALPFPFDDVTGKIVWNNRECIFTDVNARNGITAATLSAHILRREDANPCRIQLALTDLVLDDRLHERMPEQLRRVYDPYRLRGRIDASVVLSSDGHRHWQYEDLLLTAKDCSCRYEKFEYPVNGITGTIRQNGHALELNLAGQASGRPGTVTGTIIDPGPFAEANIVIQCAQLPLDATFVAACRESFRKTVESLNLEGKAQIHLQLHRPAGADQKFQMHLAGKLDNGSLEFDGFRWRVNDLSGIVTYDSLRGLWTFENLQGAHGDARLVGNGSFSKPEPEDPGELILNIDGRGAPLDSELKRALPESIQDVWTKLGLEGHANVVTAIHFTPGRPVEVVLPSAQIYRGGLLPTMWPCRLVDVEARCRYADGQVDIADFSARHESSTVRIPKAVATWHPDGQWRVSLEGLTADDLNPIPDGQLRRAFGDDTKMRAFLDELNPEGPVSLTGTLVFRGSNQQPDLVTAGWDLQLVLSRNNLRTGVQLKNISGVVHTRGTVDRSGRVVMQEGNRIEFEHAEVWGLTLTQVQGPFQVLDDKLHIGAREVFNDTRRNGSPPPVIPLSRRLTARAFGGLLTFDAVASLSQNAPYHIRATLSNGNLEQYAREETKTAPNLRGIMDGWVDVQGQGVTTHNLSGQGQLRVTRASLYELPVFFSIFTALGSAFTAPDRTAFRYALADFNIQNSQFVFKSIDLRGDAINMRGHGTANFDGRLALTFAAAPAPQGWRIPLVGLVFDSAAKGMEGLIGVEVTGHASNPDARVIAVPQLESMGKELLRALDPRAPGSLPRLMVPSFAPPQTYAPSARNPIGPQQQ